MDFEIWRSWTRLVFRDPSTWEYVLLALEFLLTLGILLAYRRSFLDLDVRRSLLLVGCIAAFFVSERLLVLDFPGRNLLPAPDVAFAPLEPFAPLLGMLPLVVAGAWLGPGPGFLVGLAKGILRVGMTTGSVAALFHLGLFGFLLGFLLRQDYRGRLALLARQPVVAVLLMTPFASLFMLLATFAQVAESGLSGFDYAMTLTGSYFGPMLVEGFAAALLIQSVYFLAPQHRPVRIARRLPPYSRTLNRRLLFFFVPLMVLMTGVLVYAVTATALRLATSEAVHQMARNANSAAEGILSFIQTGQSLLREFVSDERLWQTDEEVLEARLRRDFRMIVFFDQLLLLDADGRPLALYPPQPTGAPELTAEEQVLLERGVQSGAPQISSPHRSRKDDVVLSFLAPVIDPTEMEQDGLALRVLLGRTRPNANLILARILEGLQWSNARGTGFIVNSQGCVVAHPNPDMLLLRWTTDEGLRRIDSGLPGWAYESRDPLDKTRQLVYYLPVQGYPWGVVIRLPYDVVLKQARQIATPLLVLQILLGGGLVVIISLVTNWVTQPLKELAAAADRIADGDLSRPVDIGAPAARGGQDEVARVGLAFEDMRVRLRDRMEDLSLLLAVSQSVSATLELAEGMPFILEGALQAAEAQVARIVLLSSSGDPETVMSRGEPREGLESLDEAFVRVVKNLRHPLAIENLRRARTLLEPLSVDSGIKAVVALPIRNRERIAAVMWVGYDAERRFNESDVDLLSTLASQTSVLVENARLFQTAEGERRRLAAILSSTTDAVVVTDLENRIVLVNPAAERVFDIQGERISDQEIDETSLPKVLVDVLQEPLHLNEALTRELTLADGRTLYANLSAILSADGHRLGRVSVMRDITQLKELDELKSDFVATVSHDLRAPLTFMRGYVAMLPKLGDLNQSQQECIEKVLHGVSQMASLVDDLLDLGRIEAKAGLERRPCHLGAIVLTAVDRKRARAAAKDIALRIEPMTWDRVETVDEGGNKAKVAVVSGDAALLGQAVGNLVDNAIKYTRRGGEVVVGLAITRRPTAHSAGESTEALGRGRRALIRVSDTGIGIAPEDQVRLFEKFYRVKRGDVPDIPGTGLGLSIVKSIVERHGGRVSVESKLNKGSTFTISLPLIDRRSG